MALIASLSGFFIPLVSLLPCWYAMCIKVFVKIIIHNYMKEIISIDAVASASPGILAS